MKYQLTQPYTLNGGLYFNDGIQMQNVYITFAPVGDSQGCTKELSLPIVIDTDSIKQAIIIIETTIQTYLNSL